MPSEIEPSPVMELAPVQPGEKPMKTLAPFGAFETQAKKLVADAEAIALLDPTPANAKVARAMRLEVRPFRTSIEKKHAELKRPVLDEASRLDDAKNLLMEMLKPVEAKLLAIEQHAEREEKRMKDEKRAARSAAIGPFLTAPVAVDLADLSDDDYTDMLNDAKFLHAAKLEREAKAEAEAEAAAKTERERIEAQRLENERLKVEAAEREAAAQKEREAAAAALEAERAKAEAEAKKQREEAAERERVAAEKARKEREAIEAKAKAEREAAEAKARKERAAREKAEKEIADAQAAAQKAEAERLAALEKAAAAPDKEKLLALADAILELRFPELSTAKAKRLATDARAQLVEIADDLAATARKLSHPENE